MKLSRNFAWGPGALGLVMLLSTSMAHGFCRTTTCDPTAACVASGSPDAVGDNNICCDRSACDQSGKPIFWANTCVSYNIHQEGSVKREVDAQVFSDIVDDAYDKWLKADCEGESVSLAVDARGFAECGTPQYNQGSKDRNANVWMFRDTGDLSGGAATDADEVDASALALSTISFNADSGAIVDVDVELNSAVAAFTTTDEPDAVGIDLASVVTHETGHFLGLNHSLDRFAVMDPSYQPGSMDSRDLKQDDIDGVCAIYPANRPIEPENATCEPSGKYDTRCEGGGCGCSQAGSDVSSAPRQALLWLGALLLPALVSRRRNKSSNRA